MRSARGWVGLTKDPPTPGGDGVWRVRAETVELLRGLAAGSGDGDAAAVERATKLLACTSARCLRVTFPR